MANTLPSDDIQRLLKQVVDHFDKEDTAVRERQIRTWRRLKLYWEGFQRAWYSEVAHDWRIWDDTQGDDTDQSYYDKPVNVFRAYLESIIAALSVTVPPIKCFPDDADNPLDLSTAKAGDKIAKLVYRHNDIPLLWLHALFIYCTEGLVACYSYPKESEEYGKYEDRTYETTEEKHQYTKCPACGYTMDDQMLTPEIMAQDEKNRKKLEQYEDEYMPTDEDVPIQDLLMNEGTDVCPACMALITPILEQETLVVTRLTGITKEPKTRICLEAYGGLYVKVANYAKKQADTPYLIYAYETHYAMAVECYDHLRGKKFTDFKNKIQGSTGPNDPYEQWGRISPQYQGDYPLNTVTVRNCWLRPASFNVLGELAEINKLREKYPNGAKVVLIGDIFAEACNEALDDCWTLTQNPLSDFIHHDPLGLLLVSIQEITNDLISLILQTIEHGIGQVFVDPAVVNMNAYRQMETIPGGLYEATPKSGKSLSEAFHEVKTATLSPEVMPFAQNVQSLAQLVSGALPSLFGGAVEGSGTASEYSMSRAQALQRLQNTWKMFTIWWKQIFAKVIPMFIEEVKSDEREVIRDTNGNFINVFIRKAELEGKIGKIELEANENLPMTWSQQKDILMQLLNAGNPEILAILGAPENLPIIREHIGLTDFFVPGEDDVVKTYDDIKLLLNSEPMATGDPMMPEQPAVMPDPIFDNLPINFEIVRKWVISEAGRQAKVDNPEGYRNVLLYGTQIKQQLMMQAMQQAPTEEGAPESEGGGKASKKEAPITGESDVQTEA